MSTARKTRMKFGVRIVGKFFVSQGKPQKCFSLSKSPISSENWVLQQHTLRIARDRRRKTGIYVEEIKGESVPRLSVVFGGFLTPSDRKFTGKACAVIQSESPTEQVIYTRKNIQFAPQEALKNDHLYQTHWKYNDLPSSFPAERNNSCHSLRSLLNGRCFYSHRQGRRLDGAEAECVLGDNPVA